MTPSSDQIKYIKIDKGQKAPYAGYLLTPETLAKIIASYEKQLAESVAESTKKHSLLQSELQVLKSVHKTEIEREKSKTQSCISDMARQEDIYKKALKKNKCSWAGWPYLAFIAGGAIVGGSIAIAR